MTIDSEIATPPPLVSHDSHHGYLTTSSPLVKTTVMNGVDGQQDSSHGYSSNTSIEQFPNVSDHDYPPLTPHKFDSRNASPKSRAHNPLMSSPVLLDKPDTLRPDRAVERDSSGNRGKSPARRFKDVFKRGDRSTNVSPERLNIDSGQPLLRRPSTGFADRPTAAKSEKRTPSPLRPHTIHSTPFTPRTPIPALDTSTPPRTPPSAALDAPATTVTPPTPIEAARPNDPESPLLGFAASNDRHKPTIGSDTNDVSGTTSHRRTKSASGSLHQKSKLSHSTVPPLTPTIEEVRTPPSDGILSGGRNVSLGGGFFSSWVSAAQNAASSITNLTGQTRSRAGTTFSDGQKPQFTEESGTVAEKPNNEIVPNSSQKEPAVRTLGAGELDLQQLGIPGVESDDVLHPRAEKYKLSVDREEASAKIEDMLAKRAVSQAYERSRPSTEATPVAELTDPISSRQALSTFKSTLGTLTPPNGSIHESEADGLRRSNSVRSKVHTRRSRHSSIVPGQSEVGTVNSASTLTLAHPAITSKLPGYALAPRQRNRAFHQLFRSVPEDDCLVEDYSCALQKDILLAGRIYVSEGHICFSSNILGWVTTLIISFEEIVSIEKENTMGIIANAIAIQTLHARHVIRSLLSREATYDLMVSIWRVSHPDSFQKSINGRQLAAQTAISDGIKADKDQPDHNGSEVASEGSDVDDDDDDDDDDRSTRSHDSHASQGSENFQDTKSIEKKPSGTLTNGVASTSNMTSATVVDSAATPVSNGPSAPDAPQDFPGPTTHAPTDCTDRASHYDKTIKDETVMAPVGKVYSLLFGPQSGSFMRRYLEEVGKCTELVLEDDKKGLDHDHKTRQYKYIKPLGGSIGPKQTTCHTTETLEAFDLERSVTVNCSTATPDVPSGGAFLTKTKYCLSWASGNATRFQMNMTVEWTGKSWLKGPIEKGALDGQMSYGDDVLRALKGALGRARAPTTGSKIVKHSGGKKKRKSSRRDRSDAIHAQTKHEGHWGPLEVLRPYLGPAVALMEPIMSVHFVVGVLTVMTIWMWFRGSAGSRSSPSRLERTQQIAGYEDLWHQEEADLWRWLETRIGIDENLPQTQLKSAVPSHQFDRQRAQRHQALLKSKDLQMRLREEKKSQQELEDAVRVTQERLDVLKRSLEQGTDRTA